MPWKKNGSRRLILKELTAGKLVKNGYIGRYFRPISGQISKCTNIAELHGRGFCSSRFYPRIHLSVSGSVVRVVFVRHDLFRPTRSCCPPSALCGTRSLDAVGFSSLSRRCDPIVDLYSILRMEVQSGCCRSHRKLGAARCKQGMQISHRLRPSGAEAWRMSRSVQHVSGSFGRNPECAHCERRNLSAKESSVGTASRLNANSGRNTTR